MSDPARKKSKNVKSKGTIVPPQPATAGLAVMKGKFALSDGTSLEVSIANLPNRTDRLPTNILLWLKAHYPSDCLLTIDHESFLISGLTLLMSVPEEGAPSFPRPEGTCYPRIRVRMRTGSGTRIVEVANLPAIPDGRNLLYALIQAQPDSLFLSTDFSELRLGDIDPDSIPHLNPAAA